MTTTHSMSSVGEAALYVAFELGKRDWHLGITWGPGGRAQVMKVASGDWAAVDRAVARVRRLGAVPATAPVRSCYEAGRDGFWIHRALSARGWVNQVVDSSSLEVNRRQRRTKTDRIDARKLVTMLVRAWAGEPDLWRTVQVPSVAVEAARHVSRERSALVQERTRVQHQVESWLATYGCRISRAARRRPAWWTTARDWAGEPLPAPVQARVARAATHLAWLAEQIASLDAEQAATIAAAPVDSAARRLVALKGIAVTSASTLVAEGLVWRGFRNRRQVGGLLGFAPAKYQSGTMDRDQGVRGGGHARLQAISIELAWNWVRWQPTSALTQWYLTHFAGRHRSRRVGIVAVARKLLIALWRYVTTGVLPAGAVLKPAA